MGGRAAVLSAAGSARPNAPAARLYKSQDIAAAAEATFCLIVAVVGLLRLDDQSYLLLLIFIHRLK